MNSTWKRSFAMVLCLVMVLGMLPVNAFATECSHSYSEAVTKEASCTETGVKTYTCGSCGNAYTEEIAAASHSYSAAVTAPTCEAAGYTTYTCACGDSYTSDEVAATGHSYGEDNKCTACGAEKPEEHTHSYDEVVSDTATCTEGGVKTTKCSCGETTETESPAMGHNYVEGVCACGAKEETHVHSYSEGTVTTESTCVNEGVLTKVCDGCDDTITEAISATGEHNYENGVCACGELDYDYDWCAALGCTEEAHHADCPWGPCTLTEGCELVKNHPGECTGMDTFDGPVTVSTLTELNAAFAEGKDAKLADNITYSGVYAKEWVNVPAGVDVVLDLNGYTLGQTTTSGGGLSMSAIIVRAGAALTVKDSSTAQTGKISACNSAFQLEGKLTLESGAIVIGESHSNADVSGEMGFAYGVWMYMRNGATVAPEFYMTGGSISMVDNGYVDDYVNAVAMGDSVAGVDEYYSNATVSITGGTFEGSVVVHEKCKDITVPSGTELVKYADPVEIDTLEELLTALEADSVAAIYVTAPITISAGETVELDMNGKTVNLDANYILNNGTLTVKNGSLIADTYNGDTNGAPVWNKGSLTIVDGAKLTGVCSALRVEDGTTTINGGEFTATGDGKTASIIRMKGGSLTINDGTFTGCNSTNGSEGCSLLNATDGTTEIKGGTFSNFAGSPSSIFATGTGVTVSGGTFNLNNKTDGHTAEKVFENYLAEGFKVSGEASGTAVIEDARVAFIGETGYTTLAAALEAAKGGDTIELVWKEGDAPIAMNGAVFGKSVTITGKATVDWSQEWLYVGRGGEGNGTVTFDKAELTSASNSSSYGIHVSGREKNTNNKYDGTLIINNSDIELDYLINRGNINVNGGELIVKNGFGIAGRPAGETESGAPATATINIENGAYVKVLSHGGMGLGVASSNPEGNGVLNLNNATFECASFHVDADLGDFNVYGTSTVKIGTLTGKEIDLCNGATIKNTSVGGEAMVYGEIAFEGANTFAMIYDFGAAYSNPGAHWTVKPGASVTLTDTSRHGLGYGDKVTIQGNVTNALSERGNASQSLFMHGMSMMCAWDEKNYLTVEDAYVTIGSNNSFGTKADYGDKGDFYVVFDNSILDSSRVTVVSGGGAAYFTFNGSDAKMGAWHFNHPTSTATFTNSKMLVTGNGTDYNNANAGAMTLVNSDIKFESGAFTNTGTLTVDLDSTFDSPEIIGTGTIIIDVTNLTGDEPTSPFTGNLYNYTGEVKTNSGAIQAKLVKDEENKNGYITFETATAQVGDKYYFDLATAIADADGKTVKLLKDVTLTETIVIGNTITLDLNGKEITAPTNSFAIENKGSLTIKDSSDEGTGLITGYAAVKNAGTLTIESGSFMSTAYEAAADAAYGTAIGAVHNSGTATINGGVFNSNRNTLINTGEGTLTVNKAEVHGSSRAIYTNGKTVTINGGEFTADYGDSVVFAQGSNTVVKIASGTFTHNQQHDKNQPEPVLKAADEASIQVSGGNFSSPVDKAYCAEGMVPSQDKVEGDYYTVVKAGASVTTSEGTTTYYYSLAEAAAAAAGMNNVKEIKKLNNNEASDAETAELTGPVTISHLGLNGTLGVELGVNDKAKVYANGVVSVYSEADEPSDYGSYKLLTYDSKTGDLVSSTIVFVEPETVLNIGKNTSDLDAAFDGEYLMNNDEYNVISDGDIYAEFVGRYGTPRIKSGSKESLIARSTGFLDTCTEIYVDSERVYNGANGKSVTGVEVYEGCTEMELTSKYLKTLDVGTHSIKFYHEIDGEEYETTKIYFKITSDGSVADETNYKTGDSIFMAVSVMTFSAAALAVLLMGKKKMI